jgi:ribosomal protein L29
MNYSKEILPLTQSELMVMLESFEKEYMNLRFQKKLDSINPSSIRKVKKNIARVKTRLSDIKNNKKG